MHDDDLRCVMNSCVTEDASLLFSLLKCIFSVALHDNAELAAMDIHCNDRYRCRIRIQRISVFSLYQTCT